uniref:Ovule protein n=1 Tax=Ascaris lumbricoides TaxID=6252 RepID=A0A0M3HPF9_ASCLU
MISFNLQLHKFFALCRCRYIQFSASKKHVNASSDNIAVGLPSTIHNKHIFQPSLFLQESVEIMDDMNGVSAVGSAHTELGQLTSR